MNIVLIGMSGAGKSTLGALLAQALRMDFVDTDDIIQQQEGRLLQDILDQDGIEAFMNVEEKIVSELHANHSVIATGGSVVYSEPAMNALKQSGKIVYLHVSYEEIHKRLTNIATRGIVMKQGYSLKDVYEERILLYKKYNDITLDCSNKEIEHCVNELLGLLSE